MKRFKQKFLSFSLLFITQSIFAMEPMLVKNIRIEGLQRIEIGTVFRYLPIKIGDELTDAKSDEIINRLYSTRFFKDIRLERENDTLIVEVAERPIISELSVTGDREFDHELLLKSLGDNGLSNGKIFDQSIIDQAVLGIKAEYYNRGLYSVIITPKVIALERNRVTINIDINEGDPAKIASIQFVGNKKFSQSKLASEMYLNTGNLLSFWYKDNQYSSDKLAGDIEKIRSFYLDQGYINFKIRSIQVQLAPNKKQVYITINIDEDQQYTIKNVKVAGDTKNVPLKQLESVITVKNGHIVKQSEINKTIENIKNILGNSGYAFASVNPLPELNKEHLQVSYTFFVDTGKKVYVKQINIAGNNTTRDIVIRRELRQQENALYNASAIQRSKERLNLLGYFENADVTTAPIPGINDQVDMNIKVKETNTGRINFGVGYAPTQGVLLNGSITQANLFGSGKSASLSASTMATGQSYALSFTDPYFRPNGTSLGYDIYDSIYNPSAVGISPFSTQTIGVRARTGIPVSEFDKINFSLGFENNQITTYGNFVPSRFYQFTNQFGNSVNAIPFSASWVRNTTDSTLWPTSGSLFSQVADMTMPAVGAQYYRFNSQNTWYIPITNTFTWKINGQLGLINPYGSTTLVPFYQNFTMGGINSIPGYALNRLGPKDTDGSALGGTRSILLTNEILFPLPGIKNNNSVRLSVFYDTGTLWGGNAFNLSPSQAFRASYGMGLTWISPFGPIKIIYAQPMFNQPNDVLEPIQFMFGASF